MIRCLIIDDEPLAVQLLEDYIQQTDFLQLTGKFYNAIDAFTFLKANVVDLLFLDINMPKLTGMELTTLLPTYQKIVFTTAYSEYAVQSYEKNAVDYLLKPITFERFMKAVVKAERLFSPTLPETNEAISLSDTASVFVKTGKAIVKILFDNIVFIEGLKDYVTFHTVTEKLVVYKRMKELQDTLPANFIRIHNSYIVNASHVQKVADNQVFVMGEWVPISEKYRERFMQNLSTRLL
jgi:two-component system, LytTR family, response regulator